MSGYQYGIRNFINSIVPLHPDLTYLQARRALRNYEAISKRSVSLVHRAVGEWHETTHEPLDAYQWATEMKARGFIVVTHVNPPLAYQGPRFNVEEGYTYPAMPVDA